jgi:copper homeostasis protein
VSRALTSNLLSSSAMGSVTVEICVDSVSSAIAAERGGASRVELCSSLSDGGLTPSAGLLETTRALVTFPIHIMIRPRAGDFCYDQYEFGAMQRDIELAKGVGANAVVFGILNAEANVDVARTRQLVELSRPLSVTFHRAFDMTADLFRALEDVIATGADCLLTSGGQSTAITGQHTIAQLVKQSQQRISIMAGSGLKAENVQSFVAATAVPEIHASMRTPLPSPMQYRNPRIVLGSDGSDYERFIVREEDVRRLCLAVAAEHASE